MKRFIRNFPFAAFGVSILCILLGLTVLIWPDDAMKWMCYDFGGVLILSGILQIASYLIGERVGLLRKLLLISGIVAAVAGTWIVLSHGATEQILRLTVIVMGIVLLYHGFTDCKYGIDIKSCGTGGWAAALVLGVAVCGVGVLLLVNPFEKTDTLLFAAALGFLLDGMAGLFSTVAVAHGKAHAELIAGQANVIELDPSAAKPLPDQPEEENLPASENTSVSPESQNAETESSQAEEQ